MNDTREAGQYFPPKSGAAAGWRGETEPVWGKDRMLGNLRARNGLFDAILILGLGIISFMNARNVAFSLSQNSDSVQSFLAGNAVAHANLLLSGWHISQDSYYFTDTIPFAVLELLEGPRPYLLAVVPALTYGIFVLTATIICFRPLRSRLCKLETAATIALVLGCPYWVGHWDPVLFADFHLGSVLGSLVALTLATRLYMLSLEMHTDQHRINIGLGCLLVTCATVASDPFSVFFAFGPAMLAFILQMSPLRRAYVASVACLGSGVLLGLVFPPAVRFAGGFVAGNNISAVFVSGDKFGANLGTVAMDILRLAGAYPFGLKVISPAAGLAVLRCAGFAIAVFAVWRVLRGAGIAAHEALLDRVLCVCILALVAFCVFSSQFSWDGGAIRYLTPAILFAAVLAGRQVSALLQGLQSQAARYTARGLLLVSAGVMLLGGERLFGIYEIPPDWKSNTPAFVAERWLDKRRLTHGVGEYWSASIVTAMSGGRIQVGPVTPSNRRFVPYLWVADTRWFTTPPQFIIWQNNNPAGVTLQQVRAAYCPHGCPVATVGDFKIAVLGSGNNGKPASD
jgi:hypothetical protein